MGNEREQDTWLGNMLRRSPATASDACLDAETLGAWADGGLNAKAAEAVELHASNCARCAAVLATMERTAPVAAAAEAWTLARVFRWVAPLAAAATAVAIWVAVPDRTIAPVESTVSQDLKSTEQVPVPDAATEPRTLNQNPATETGTAEPQERSQLRDELRRERAEPQALGSVAAPAAPKSNASAPGAPAAAAPARIAPTAPAPVAPTAPIAPSAPVTPGGFAPEAPLPAAEAMARADAPSAASPAPPPQAYAADAVAESAASATAQRSAMSLTARSVESISPTNTLMRWRVVQPVSVERSLDGGKTWVKTTLPAPNVVSIRGVDGDRAVATTSDKTQFYTANGGRSWTRVQENSAAPF